MVLDNSFWAFIALLLFFGIVIYYKAPALAGRALDKRAERIRREVDEARELKDEATQQLAEFQRRRKEAEQEAKEIVAAARREADALVAEARQKSEEYVARRTAMAETKIAQAENDAIAEVRASAVDIAVAAAGRIIAERNAGTSGNLTDRSIAEVRQRLN
ncbi:F0F1 ATP synthase subunit B [Mangrovicella endophytica]|uniref:F0F1 ATP synthase subunit B n=1 Tax=Mangrovicella endophytica TaxID=2066697 RepID=UPI000C9EBD95|nr:F0F1 ATP synthase subunit B [Mangrovicella endophytica]